MSLSDYIPEKFIELFSDPDFSNAIKGYNMYLIKEDKEYRDEVKKFITEELDTSFDTRILTSELSPVQRIASLENVTGITDFSDFEEEEAEHEPTLPEKISRLEEITACINKADNPIFSDKSLIPPSKNITEIRADYLADYIIENSLIPKAPSVFANIEVKVMDSNEFRYFVEHILPAEYRPESTTTDGFRKLKKDVFETAAERHKSRGIDIDKADHGRQELRLLYFREKTMEEMQPQLTVTA